MCFRFEDGDLHDKLSFMKGNSIDDILYDVFALEQTIFGEVVLTDQIEGGRNIEVIRALYCIAVHTAVEPCREPVEPVEGGGCELNVLLMRF